VRQEDVKLQEAETQLKVQESEVRADHIKNMQRNRDKLAGELEKLKQQLAQQQAQGRGAATQEDNFSTPVSTDQAYSVQSYGQAQSPAATYDTDQGYGQTAYGQPGAPVAAYAAPSTAPRKKEF